MTKFSTIAILAILAVTGCSEVTELRVGDATGINPTVLQKIDVSDRQSILFGHYEDLVTVHGRTFEGCCVFDANRIELANYIVRLFENTTGEDFANREMLIGAVNDKVYVYIVPKALTAAPRAKTYVVELDKKTAVLNSFKATTN
jgi:hypothetical protein